MDSHLTSLLIVFGTFGLAILSPGPNMIVVIDTAMRHGRKAATKVAFGVGSGSFIWGALALAGVTSLIATNAGVLGTVRAAGAIYLFWLAIRALKAVFGSTAGAARDGAMSRSSSNHLARGLLIQMTNPKAAVTWIAVLSIAVGPQTPYWIGLTIVIGVGVMSFAAYFFYAVAFSTPATVIGYQRFVRPVNLVLALFFSYAGYALAASSNFIPDANRAGLAASGSGEIAARRSASIVSSSVQLDKETGSAAPSRRNAVWKMQ